MTSAVAHSPMLDIPAPGRFREAIVPMCSALVGAGALVLGADHIGKALLPVTAGLIRQRSTNTPQKTDGTLPAEAHQALVDTLREQSSSLSITAQIAVAIGWQQTYDRAALSLEKALVQSGVAFSDMPSEHRTGVIRDAVVGALAGKTTWLAGKGLALATAVPIAVLYAASKVKWMAPLYFITGTVAAAFAQPFLNRLAGRVRVWSTSPEDRHVQAALDTPFHRTVSRVGDNGMRQHDLFHTGRHYVAEARRMLATDLSDAAAAPTDEMGERRIALALADMAATFPEMIIHDVWSENLAAQLHRFQKKPSHDSILRHLKALCAKYEWLSLPALRTHLDAALRPQDWQSAAAAS